MVDLLPESNEIVDCRNAGDQNSEIDGCDSDPLDWNDEKAELPLIPLVGKDGRDHRHNLDDSLQFAEITGLNGEALRRSDGTQPGDKEFAPDDDDNNPYLFHFGIVGNQGDERTGDHDLVCDGIEQHPHGGDLTSFAGQVAVEAIGDGSEHKED